MTAGLAECSLSLFPVRLRTEESDLIWMACDCKNCDRGNPRFPFSFIGAVMPEDSIRGRGVVLGVSFKEFFAARARERCELVCMKAGMVRVNFEVGDSLLNLLEKWLSRRSLFQRGVLVIRSRREFDLSLHDYFLAYLANEPRQTCFPSADSLNPCFKLARAFWFL